MTLMGRHVEWSMQFENRVQIYDAISNQVILLKHGRAGNLHNA